MAMVMGLSRLDGGDDDDGLESMAMAMARWFLSWHRILWQWDGNGDGLEWMAMAMVRLFYRRRLG
jgi:hypothetical protein